MPAGRRPREADDDAGYDDDLDDTITTPADQLPVIHGYDRTIRGMPAAPLPRAALPPMESEPVRVGGRGYRSSSRTTTICAWGRWSRSTWRTTTSTRRR